MKGTISRLAVLVVFSGHKVVCWFLALSPLPAQLGWEENVFFLRWHKNKIV